MSEKYLKRAIEDTSKKIGIDPRECGHLRRDINELIQDFQEIKTENPEITSKDIMDNIEEEINRNIEIIYRTKMILPIYKDYICTKFLVSDDEKFKEIEEIVKNSDKDYKSLQHWDCSYLDENLEVAMYTAFDSAFSSILYEECERTEENIKKFPDVFERIKKEKEQELITRGDYTDRRKLLFSTSMSDEERKDLLEKELSTIDDPFKRKELKRIVKLYQNPAKQILSEVMANSNTELGKELAMCIQDIYERLRDMGKIKDYMISFIGQMCQSDFPEYIADFIKQENINDIRKFGQEIKQYGKDSEYYRNKKIEENINLEKLDSIMSRENLSKLEIEQLFALSSFWSNRLSKELDDYAKTIFVSKNLGIIDQIMEGKEVIDVKSIPDEELRKNLMKLGIFYNSAYRFLKSNETTTIGLRDIQKDAETVINKKNVNTLDRLFEEVLYIQADVGKVGREYGEWIKDRITPEEYEEYFSKELPNEAHNLQEDASLALELYAPIHDCYDLKDKVIECALMGLEYDPDGFYNAGIIKDDEENSTNTNRKTQKMIIGMDVGLSFPVRLHVYKENLIGKILSMNSNSITRQYMGEEDFSDSQKSAHIVLPLEGRMKRELDNKIKDVEKNPKKYKENGNFILHLGFNENRGPKHLITRYKTDRGRKKTEFIPTYIDLLTGEEYTLADDTYIYKDEDERLKQDGSER